MSAAWNPITYGYGGAIQLRRFPRTAVLKPKPIDEPQLRSWPLRDIRALAIDLDVEMRRMAALTGWAIDADIQRVLASDPDGQVVLNLLSQVDPHAEATHFILTGPHTAARRDLARRNLSTSTLLTLVDDHDEVVRSAARATLERHGVLAGEAGPSLRPKNAPPTPLSSAAISTGQVAHSATVDESTAPHPSTHIAIPMKGRT